MRHAIFTALFAAAFLAGCGGGGGSPPGDGSLPGADGGEGAGTIGGGFAATGEILAEVAGLPEWGHGTALALADAEGDGDLDVFVGYPGNEIDGQPDAGAVMLYKATSGGFGTPIEITAADWWPTVPQVGGRFGMYLYAGDFDGDGLDDVAIGAPSEDVDGVVDAGRVYIRFGSPDGLGIHSGPFGDPRGGTTGDQFGGCLATGDVDGDGRDDLVIGVPLSDVAGNEDAGNLWIFLGDGPYAIGERFIGPGTEAQPRAGAALGTLLAVDDLDGDGLGEILGCAPGTRETAGRVTAFGLDIALRFVPRATFPVPPGGAGSLFGAGIITDDLDGDGDTDVVIGAPHATSEGLLNAGYIAVYENTTTGPALSFAPATVFGEAVPFSGAEFGAALNVTDADGDGLSDIVVGAPGSRISGLQHAGRVTVLLQDAGLVFGVPGRRILHSPAVPEESSAYGAWIEVGDIDGDGLDDLVTGASGPVEDGIDPVLRRSGFVEVLPAVR